MLRALPIVAWRQKPLLTAAVAMAWGRARCAGTAVLLGCSGVPGGFRLGGWFRRKLRRWGCNNGLSRSTRPFCQSRSRALRRRTHKVRTVNTCVVERNDASIITWPLARSPRVAREVRYEEVTEPIMGLYGYGTISWVLIPWLFLGFKFPKTKKI